jgi:hypothetical protein
MGGRSEFKSGGGSRMRSKYICHISSEAPFPAFFASRHFIFIFLTNDVVNKVIDDDEMLF